MFFSPVWSSVSQALFTSGCSQISSVVCMCVAVMSSVKCTPLSIVDCLFPTELKNSVVMMSFFGRGGVKGRSHNFHRPPPCACDPTKGRLCPMRRIAGAHSPVAHSLSPPTLHAHMKPCKHVYTHTHTLPPWSLPLILVGKRRRGGGEEIHFQRDNALLSLPQDGLRKRLKLERQNEQCHSTASDGIKRNGSFSWDRCRCFSAAY